MDNENYFKKLYEIDVKSKVEKKNKLSYLSWAWAWAEVKKMHPTANYKIYETTNGCIYWHDGKTAWVKTGAIIDGLEHIEYLPIMDYANKSILIEKITSFDVNKSIQRSLTKAFARHGLGLCIYAGEDLPESAELTDHQKLGNCVDDEEMQQLKQQKKEADEVERKAKAKSYCAQLEAEIKGCGSQSEIEAIFEREAKNLKSLQSRHPELFKKLFEHSVKCSVPDSEENSGALQGVVIANLKQILLK